MEKRNYSSGVRNSFILLLSTLIVFCFPATAKSQVAIAGQDFAANYDDSWAGNGGFGFGNWNLYRSNDSSVEDAGHFLDNGTQFGHGDINTSDVRSFGMYGNNGAYSNAERSITHWGDGYSFTIQIATRWRDGARGISLFDVDGFGDGNKFWYFNITNTGYGDTGWEYSDNIIVQLTATQQGGDLIIELSATGENGPFANWQYTINDKTLGGFRLYTGGHNQGTNGERNLYFNNLYITSSNPNLELNSSINVKSLIIGGGETLNSGDKNITLGNEGFFENNGTFNAGTGTVIFTGPSEVMGSSATIFHDVVLEAGITEGVNFGENKSIITGTFYVKLGFVDQNGPAFEENSLLFYQNTPWEDDTDYTRQAEWNNPWHVQVGFNTHLNLNLTDWTGDLTIRGNLIVDENSSVTVDNGHSRNLIVEGDVLINGTLTLQESGQDGGFSDLEVGGNLSNNNNLNHNNREVIFQGSDTQQISGVSSLGYMRVDKEGGDILLSGNLTITDRLALDQGIIHTGAHNIIIENTTPGAITQETTNPDFRNSYIVGNLQRRVDETEQPYHFPLGNEEAAQPAIINFSALTSTHEETPLISASFLSQSPGYGNLPQPFGGITITSLWEKGFWRINPTHISSCSYSLTLMAEGLPEEINPDKVRILKSPDNANIWSLAGIFQETSGNLTITHTGINGFSDFALGGDSNNVLPIELISFEASQHPQGALIEWATAAEINNDFFTLLRSTNGQSFDAIVKIPGAGNSNQILHYNYFDSAPEQGINYYILRQTDFDGTFADSPMIALYNSEHAEASVILSQGTILANLNWSVQENGVAGVYDTAGRNWIRENFSWHPGQTVQIDANALSPGIYVVVFTGERNFSSQKILVK